MNAYAPGKRPFHTIIPAFITKYNLPYVSFGLTGGGMQPQGHVQIVMNLIDFNMNLQEAGDAPRVRHEYSYGRPGDRNTATIQLESGLPYHTIRELIKMGHDVSFGFEALVVTRQLHCLQPSKFSPLKSNIHPAFISASVKMFAVCENDGNAIKSKATIPNILKTLVPIIS